MINEWAKRICFERKFSLRTLVCLMLVSMLLVLGIQNLLNIKFKLRYYEDSKQHYLRIERTRYYRIYDMTNGYTEVDGPMIGDGVMGIQLKPGIYLVRESWSSPEDPN